MIYVFFAINFIFGVTSFIFAMISFKESKKLNNKWKIFKKTKTERNYGFKIIC